MANPQAENGHVDIANEIVEALCRFRLSGEEMQCLWVILRKTYGWHKRVDRISLSQFAAMTGLKKQTVHRALKKLSSKMIIVIIKNDDGQINSFRFNKDFDKWIPSSKKITPSSILIKGVIKNDDEPSSKMINTKENKETITKENILILPHVILYLNQKTGKHFSFKTKAYQRVIKARCNEGKTEEDFKRVIDIKFIKWGSDPKMIDFLRPETLFGTKMDSYLQEDINTGILNDSNLYFKNDSGNYQCKSCAKTYMKFENLQEHLKEHN